MCPHTWKDYLLTIPSHYKGDLSRAFLDLLMIAAPYRKQMVGKVVVDAVEKEIRRYKKVSVLGKGIYRRQSIYLAMTM